MKILIIIDSLGSGGAERSTAVMANYMAEQSIQFTILCLEEKSIGVQQQLQEFGYDISFLKSSSFLTQVAEIVKYIKEGNYCLVHSVLFKSNLRTRFAKLLVGFTHLESLVNTTYSKERFKDKKVNQKILFLYKILDRITSNLLVNHFHSITETVKYHYINELKINPEKFSVIYRGRKPLINEYSANLNEHPKLKLINVGRHEFQKGQIFLLKAIKELKEKGYNFELDIFGRNGSESALLNQYIDDHELHEYVKLKGYSHSIPNELLSSDLFVFPSLYEGLGGALIEAQAAALPIVCNDIPVLHEVVNEDVNAKFFKVDDISSIVKSIVYFIENPEARIKYGKASLFNFNAKYLESENNELLMKLYYKLCYHSEK